MHRLRWITVASLQRRAVRCFVDLLEEPIDGARFVAFFAESSPFDTIIDVNDWVSALLTPLLSLNSPV